MLKLNIKVHNSIMELRFGLIFLLVVQLITISSSSSVAMSNPDPENNKTRATNNATTSSAEPSPIDIGITLSTSERQRSVPANETSSGIFEDFKNLPSKISSSFMSMGCTLGVSSCKNETVKATTSPALNVTAPLNSTSTTNTTSPAAAV